MALFKISKGLKTNLPSTLTEGYCWYTYNDSKFYIDFKDDNGVLTRKALNAQEAEKLTGYDIATILNSSDIEIPTSKAVLTALAGKSDTTHKHDDAYDTKGAASAVQQTLTSTINSHTGNTDIHVTTTNKSNWNTAYTHSQAAHARTDATKVADSTTNGNILINGTETTVYSHPNSGVSAGTYKSVTVNAQGHITGGSNPTTLAGYGITDAESKGTVSTHNTSTSAHTDIRDLINDLTTKLNNFLDVDDTTTDQLSELIALIQDNADDIESITSGKVNVSDIVNNLTTNVTNKPLSAAQGVAIKALIDGLDLALDTHDANTTKHITSTERTNWNAAKTHADSAHAPSNAQPNQNAFSNIAVSGQTTVAADTTTDTVTFVGSNVSITTDATNDKVTFSVANGTTSAKGVVQLTDSTSSTSTTTAATPKNVKAAYDLADTAKTNASNAQTRADQAYDLADLAMSVVHIGPTEPTDPNVKVWINTSEEGTGVIPVIPRVATITLSKSAWTGSANPYSQAVNIATVTASTKIDLQPTAQQIIALNNEDIALIAQNDNGVVTIYALGGKPSTDYVMQVLLTEVAYV